MENSQVCIVGKLPESLDMHVLLLVNINTVISVLVQLLQVPILGTSPNKCQYWGPVLGGWLGRAVVQHTDTATLAHKAFFGICLRQ